MRLPAATVVFTALSTNALAHAGEHHDVTGLNTFLEHLLGSPFHMAVFGAAIVAACALAAYWRINRSPPPRTKLENKK